ncbi:cytochrome P450 [Burkholderia sp. Ac-20345]|uniref:cytochrome P450 family protein n=1 Tax=Burkholderia sp. Ac-20345 TaxID=2703891 RepID=UPI00197C1971|nr:cytochrome P450 [Burkholderia sp. Ac-20345]MBN3779014.1 cytochrome P450 [Burkholderia sp. Ac-20345]
MTESNFQLSGSDFVACPYSTYARMRAEDPVYQHKSDQGDTIWYVTRYEDVQFVLRDKRFVLDWRNTLTDEERSRMPSLSPAMRRLTRHLLSMDGAEHAGQRALINKAFTNHAVEEMRERIEAIAEELIDSVVSHGRMDLIEDFALPLPMSIIMELLGVPGDDYRRFRAWSQIFVNENVGPVFQQRQKALAEFAAYLEPLIAERREHPRQDLLTALVQAESDGSTLSAEEIYSMAMLLLVAGHETSSNLIGNSVVALLQHPDQLAKLRRQPELWEQAIEELLRYGGSIEAAMLRFATEDLDLGDKRIRRGDAVRVLLTSANRDETQFDHPEALDLERPGGRHLAFGVGVHYCLGAPLARMEAKIAIDTLLRRLPNLRIAEPLESLERVVALGATQFRGLRHIPLAWDI